jgi:hypothetical protein
MANPRADQFLGLLWQGWKRQLLVGLVWAWPCAAQKGDTWATLIFGGDIIPHEPLKQVATLRAHPGQDGNTAGWNHILGALAPTFESADLAVVNLETPIVTLKKPERGDMIFSAPPELLTACKHVGIDVATFANNHCLDQHREGILSTRAFLAEAHLLSAGADGNETAAWTPLVVNIRGLRIGILAVTRWLNGFHNTKNVNEPHVPAVPYASEPIHGGRSRGEFLQSVKQSAATVDALIVSIHWGTEYQHVPTSEDRLLAKQMLEHGALVVIGHHPHVLQPVEFMETNQGSLGLVAFSLGNLVSNQDFNDRQGTKRDGLLLAVTLSRPAAGAPVQVASWSAIPIATENRLGPGKQRNVQAVVLEDEIQALEARLVMIHQRGASSQELRALEARLQGALVRRSRILSFLPAQTH